MSWKELLLLSRLKRLSMNSANSSTWGLGTSARRPLWSAGSSRGDEDAR